MFILKCKIAIGEYVFNSVHEVEITKSVDELMDTALIKLPTRFKVRSTGELKYIEDVLRPGDKVEITLAYEGKFEKMEFAGYVAKVSPKIPLEIHCEDAMRLLRRKSITKAFGKTTMKDVLREVVAGTGLELAPDIPHHPIDKLIIKEQNGTQVLQYFKENHMMTSFIDDAGRLYCGLAQLTNIGQSAKYDLNYNLVSNDLEFKTEDDKKIRVKYTYIAKDNKKTTVEVGDPEGEIRSLNTHIVSNESQLKEMATAELKKLKYAGFEGSVKSFLIPYATRGMAAEIIDTEHPNRTGNYFIKKVVTIFGTSGARRTVTIGNKL